MSKTKKIPKGSPEPYEDLIRLEELDPYEAQIKSTVFIKKKNKSIL
tara:strand:- start:283 stop:420 length:138 start_codon:yes stop_codon:yes gene_type:complete